MQQSTGRGGAAANFRRVKSSAGACGLAFALAAGAPAAAADLGYAPRGAGFSSYAPPAPPPFAYAVDPRCAIVPMPQLDLVGDTARFRATAVCQSRGLYTDSLNGAAIRSSARRFVSK